MELKLNQLIVSNSQNKELVQSDAQKFFVVGNNLSLASASKEIDLFVDAFFKEKNNFSGALPRTLCVQQLPTAGSARLEINFFENRLVTHFQGEEHTSKLSVTLGNVRDILEIFAKMQSATSATKEQAAEKRVAVQNDFARALANAKNTTTEFHVKIDRVDVLSIYPLNGRAVTTTSRGKSSIPLFMMQNCAHLFNPQFAERISPLLGTEPTVEGLFQGLHNLYLGRCLVGLGQSIATGHWSQQANQREFARIVTLMVAPGAAFYTEPLL